MLLFSCLHVSLFFVVGTIFVVIEGEPLLREENHLAGFSSGRIARRDSVQSKRQGGNVLGTQRRNIAESWSTKSRRIIPARKLGLMSSARTTSPVPTGGFGRQHPCSGRVSGTWDGDSWIPAEDGRCRGIYSDEALSRTLDCLSGKHIAFLGDSHVRNLFRCAAEVLTVGRSKLATEHYTSGWNDPEEPPDWPKYHHITMSLPRSPEQPPPSALRSSSSSTNLEAREPGSSVHELSCHNHAKIHRHDYTVALPVEGRPPVRLDFYWQPWGGSRPLLQTEEYVRRVGSEAAAYRFNYTGGRARGTFLERLKQRARPDLVVTGGEERNHSGLYRSFPGRAVLINHAGSPDGLRERAAAHGIPTADVTEALRAWGPDPEPEAGAPFGVPRPRHVPAQVLRLQCRILLALAADRLCPPAGEDAALRRPRAPP